MRVQVAKEIEFDAGHRVPDHASKCRNPHGHRYKVRAVVEGAIVDDDGEADTGMVVDFGLLKQWLTTEIHDRFDHGFLVYAGDAVMLDVLSEAAGTEGWNVQVTAWVPTAENIARWCFTELAPIVAAHWRTMRLVRIDVHETPTSVATIVADDFPPEPDA